MNFFHRHGRRRFRTLRAKFWDSLITGTYVPVTRKYENFALRVRDLRPPCRWKKFTMRYCLICCLERDYLRWYNIHSHVLCEMFRPSKRMVVYFVYSFQGTWGSFKGTKRFVVMGWSCLYFFVNKYGWRHASHYLWQSQKLVYLLTVWSGNASKKWQDIHSHVIYLWDAMALQGNGRLLRPSISRHMRHS